MVVLKKYPAFVLINSFCLQFTYFLNATEKRKNELKKKLCIFSFNDHSTKELVQLIATL